MSLNNRGMNQYSSFTKVSVNKYQYNNQNLKAEMPFPSNSKIESDFNSVVKMSMLFDFKQN